MNTRSQTRFQNRSLIEKLPFEMQLEIFSYLDPWSLRRCSETCVIFFHVTLHPCFRQHFKLHMFEVYLAPDCGIGEAFAAGTRTKRTFDTLHLSTVNFQKLPFSKNFFMRLGPEIRELFLYETFLVPPMTVLETEKTELNLRRNILTNFPNLRTLVVQTNKELEELLYYPASLKNVTVKSVLYNHDNVNKDYVEMWKANCPTLNLEKFVMSEVRYSCDHFKETSHKNRSLSDATYQAIEEAGGVAYFDGYDAECNILQHTIVAPTCIKGLSFKSLPRISYAALGNFPRLKSLDFNMQRPLLDDCFSDHDEQVPDLSHIKHLRLIINPYPLCDVCMRKFFAAFPGLVELSISGSFTETHIRLIFQQLRKLELLEVIGSVPHHFFDAPEYTEHSLEHLKNLHTLLVIDYTHGRGTGISNADLLKFSHMPNLRKLGLLQDGDLRLDGIQNLVEKCPSIANFNSTANTIDSSMVREMLRGWPRLHTLSLTASLPFNIQTWREIQNLRFLENLAVSSYQPLLTFAQECTLFESIPMLKKIRKGCFIVEGRQITRSEFYEQDSYLETHGMNYTETPQVKRKFTWNQSKSNKRRRLTYSKVHRNYHRVTPLIVRDMGDDTEEEDEEDFGDGVHNGCIIN